MAKDGQRREAAETLYIKTLTIRRQLVQDNPIVFQPHLAITLLAFGAAYLDWGELEQALPLLQESAQLFAPFAQQAPNVFSEQYNMVTQLLEYAENVTH